MLKTFGLTHLALEVADLARSIAFYQQLLGASVLWRNDTSAEIGVPGAKDVITLRVADGPAVRDTGHISHFGFRLVSAEDVDVLIAAVESAGGTVTESGHFGPGQPVVMAQDPDGYVIELWYEDETGARD